MNQSMAHPWHCVVCQHLIEADQRYLRRLQTDRRMRCTLTEALVASMGFCDHHWQRLQESDPDIADWSRRCVSEATTRLGELFARTKLQDEFLQDLLFGARSRCPACLSSSRLEGRLLTRLLLDLESKRTSLRSLFSTQVCFEHARQLTGRAEGALRVRMRPALRKRSEHILSAAISIDAADASSGCPIEGLLTDALYPRVEGFVERSACDDALAHSTDSCPVCMEMESGRRHWLKAVVENIRLGQPAWLTLPTCAEHTLMCLNTGDRDVALAVAQRYVDASLAPPRRRVVSLVRKRRRGSTRWFNAPAASADAAAEGPPAESAPAAETVAFIHCPGCQQSDVAMRRAVFSFLRSFGRATDMQAPLLLGQLCLKHLAEVMIYAPDERTQARMVKCLNKARAKDCQAVTVPADAL
ncbi:MULTISPECIES: hypothetical protein [Burkholderia cepacia complex]|jgi:hypothetical protein|uniref:Uncharacterized protein n=1 Tax=Burkholderia vietnamiensis TaxID=60552 RepID=A0AAW7T6B6_BURVI|nr:MULTISPECIES: hypothetical protein [Burkholderia cepacia complex]MDN7797085.1 hypothetical protein [Burkholderia vietnamiensis]